MDVHVWNVGYSPQKLILYHSNSVENLRSQAVVEEEEGEERRTGRGGREGGVGMRRRRDR